MNIVCENDGNKIRLNKALSKIATKKIYYCSMCNTFYTIEKVLKEVKINLK